MGRMTMRIPLVDLGLPPVAWFSVVPVLLFILHVDLLHNLNEHLAKLQLWRDLNQGHVDSRDLQPFFYDFAFAHRGEGLIGWLLDWSVWLLIYLLPSLRCWWYRYVSVPIKIAWFRRCTAV